MRTVFAKRKGLGLPLRNSSNLRISVTSIPTRWLPCRIGAAGDVGGIFAERGNVLLLDAFILRSEVAIDLCVGG